MNYIVTGHRRTGTTAMMKALEAGGMRAEYANEDYELEDDRLEQSHFPLQYQNSVIKVLNFEMVKLRRGIKYRVIYMRRKTADIRKSFEKRYGDEWWCKRFYDNHYWNNVDRRAEEALIRIRKRVDVALLAEIYYEELRHDAINVFKSLKHFGWNINPELCAEVIH